MLLILMVSSVLASLTMDYLQRHLPPCRYVWRSAAAAARSHGHHLPHRVRA